SFYQIYRSSFFSVCYFRCRDLRSFPSRRSSDLQSAACGRQLAVGSLRSAACGRQLAVGSLQTAACRQQLADSSLQTAACRQQLADRKSTRLNSSHVKISYAVFCLKKKMAIAISI